MMLTYNDVIDRLQQLRAQLEVTTHFGGIIHGRHSYGQKEMRDAIDRWIERMKDRKQIVSQTKGYMMLNSYNPVTKYTEHLRDFMHLANEIHNWANKPQKPMF